MNVHYDIQGAGEIRKLLAVFAVGAVTALEKVLYETATEVFAETQRLVPVRYGVLKGSGQVKEPKGSGTGFSVDIVYGGPAAPYAIYVHERLDQRHAAPTQAKFLEAPMLKAPPKLQANAQVALVAALRAAKAAS